MADGGDVLESDVRESVLRPRFDIDMYGDRTVRRDYGHHALVRYAITSEAGTVIRYYWHPRRRRRMRVPWIVWAMFS